MKKILSILSAAAVLFGAASCEKDNLGGNKETANPLNTITVITGTDSKLAIDDETLIPAFEIDDVIFGWDSEGTAYAYTCTEVTEDAATFTRTSSGAPSADEGTVVNLVYAPGYEIEDIVDKTLDVNLAVQGEALPVVMHTSGTVDEEGICNVIFLNDVAIVDVKDAVLPDAVEDEEYTISFHGKNTSLKFALNEFGMLTVEPAVAGPISSSEKAKVSADSKISKKFAVPASGEAADVTIMATAADGSAYTFSAGSREIVAGKYITVKDKEFTPQYVAQIGSDKYTSLAKAVAAANVAEEDVTIEMLNDAETNKPITVKNTNGKKITLKLNECTISSDLGGENRPFTLASDFDINGEGGTIENTGSAALIYVNTPSINVNINGGHFIGRGRYGTIRFAGDDSELTITGTTIVEAKGSYSATEGNRAINLGISDKSSDHLTINSANVTVISEAGEALKVQHGTATISAGTFVGATSAVITNTSNSDRFAEISGGYFYNGNSEDPCVTGAGMTGKISGGKFSKGIEATYCVKGKICKAMDAPETIEGRTYSHEIVDGVYYVAHIGSVNYETFLDALGAAKAATDDVEIVMDSNSTLDGINNDFTNSNGKTITVNLNGNTLNTTERNAIVTTGNLVIKGTETGEGTVSGSKNRIIFVQGAGSITLKNCNFQTSSTNYNTTIDSSAIVVHGTSGAKAGQIILEKVKASTGTTRTTLCGVNYGTLKIIDSELSVNGAGYHCIKSTSGAQVEIKGSSLYTANSEGNTYSCYYITGQSNAKITIEGSYLYSESGVCIRDHSYAQAITINSGYFNCDVSKTSSNVKYAEGVNKSDCSEKHTHAGKEYTYTWKVTK